MLPSCPYVRVESNFLPLQNNALLMLLHWQLNMPLILVFPESFRSS
jgi:hypothetical protein